MKAVRIHQFGGPEVLRHEDVPDPKPRKDQVLIRVRACALNHLDLWVRKGLPGVPLPHILGSDIAGEIVEAGEYVWAQPRHSHHAGGGHPCSATQAVQVHDDERARPADRAERTQPRLQGVGAESALGRRHDGAAYVQRRQVLSRRHHRPVLALQRGLRRERGQRPSRHDARA